MPRIQFKGKDIIVNHHLAVPYHQLQADPKKSVLGKGKTASLHDNIILHGDNLLALKALLPTHGGKVNCIYIDPPYNTGNEGWAYSDNVSNTMIKDWLGKAVDKDDLTRHDKWLCMMWPRLSLLYELLAEDGVIFVSIDDNEAHRLRMVMDEIFGEGDFVASFIWHHRKSSQNDIDVSLSHNYIHCYAKNSEKLELGREEIDETKFSNTDGDPRGPWTADPMDAPGTTKKTYPIINPNTNQEHLPPEGRHWRFSQEKYNEALNDNRIVFGKRGKTKPQYKRFLSEARDAGVNVFTIWSDVQTATDAKKETNEIFGKKNIFETPKPVSLLKKILNVATTKDSIVLDSFAGSGTTAQAVLELNKLDGGDRKFVLVECEKYADKITAERVRRVIKGVKGAKDENVKTGLGGMFSYWTLGDAIKMRNILTGGSLPEWEELARYIFYTATGEEWNPAQKRKRDHYIGESHRHQVYLYYKPDIEYLTKTAFTLEMAEKFPAPTRGKTRLVFAPVRYVKTEELNRRGIKYCQLPFEIYRIASQSGKTTKSTTNTGETK